MLDDPTSSLDNKVTVEIMKAINKDPWKEKTFILSTNNTKLLEFVDRVIYIENGSIRYFGSFEEMKKNPELTTILKESAEDEVILKLI